MAGHSASKDARKRAGVPAIRVFLAARKTWMPGTRPGMTVIANALPHSRGACTCFHTLRYACGISHGAASMLRACALLLGLCAAVAAAPSARGEEPFYKGKRLTLLVNY